MYINELKIRNLRCFERADLTFSVPGDPQDGLNVVIGPNMSGKTTLFHSILWSLLGTRINRVPGDAPALGSDLEIQRRPSEADSWSAEVVYSVGGSRHTSGIARGIGSALTRHDARLARHYVSPDPAPPPDSPFLLYYPSGCHAFSELPTVKAALDIEEDWREFSPYSQALSRTKLSETIRLYLRYRKMGRLQPRGRITRRPVEDQPFDHRPFKAALEELLDARMDMEGFHKKRGELEWRLPPSADVSGSPVHAPALSAGFISAFGVAVDLFVRLSKLHEGLSARCAVILDEFSGFLHPKWQQAFLPMLRDLFPNTQFIVATHSPFVLGSVPSARLFSLEREENLSTVEDRTESAHRLTMEQVLECFDVSLTSPAVRRLEAEYERLSSEPDSADVRGAMRHIEGVLAAIDPAFRVLSRAAPTPTAADSMLKLLRTQRGRSE